MWIKKSSVREFFRNTAKKISDHFRKRRARSRCTADDGVGGDEAAIDINILQTRLGKAVASEDFAEAARLRDQIAALSGGENAIPPGDWKGLGMPEWLADRAERMGFMIPTDIQRRTSRPFLLGADVLMQAQTGSGKTLAFVMPTLAMLAYPPTLCDLKIEFSCSLVSIDSVARCEISSCPLRHVVCFFSKRR
jgi:Rad3-related DNA helicase